MLLPAAMDRDAKLRAIEALFYRDYREDGWFDSVLDKIRPDSRALEIGAGSGEGAQSQLSLKGRCKHIVGIDLDPRVLRNPNHDETRNISVYDLAGAFDEKFDVIYSTMVVEHIDDADRFIEAQLAVLATGGTMIHHTVSKYFYTSLLNKVVGNRLKWWLIARLGSGRSADDVFPAHYKLNSARQIRALAERHDLAVTISRYSASPGYLRRSYALMLLYILVDKPLSALIPALRTEILMTMRRKQDAA